MYSVLNSSYNFFMVVNFIAHMVHSPPIHNDCFVNKDFIIIIIIISAVSQYTTTMRENNYSSIGMDSYKWGNTIVFTYSWYSRLAEKYPGF